MNKPIIIIVIAALLLAVGLSGCNEEKVEVIGDTDKVEMVSYSIETYDNNGEKIGGGFVHDSKAYLYKITGTVKNIAGEMLNVIWTSAKFYDRGNNYLNSLTYAISDLANNYTANFSMTYPSSEVHFENVDSIQFVFIAIRE